MDINAILRTHFVHALTRQVCGDDIELIKRPASFMIRSRQEKGRDMERVIILPPHGFTADKITQTNSHDEASFATIEIKGAVREGKNGFSRLRDCLKMASIPQNGAVSELNKPYMTYELEGDTNPDLTITTHSAGTAPFAVVKSDGYGFYHNLINITDDWLVLKLHKRLREQKGVELSAHLATLPAGQAEILQRFYDAVVEHGDEVFYRAPELIESVCLIPPHASLPALAEMLYTHDTGKHEACSVFATILKIGKQHPQITQKFLQNSLQEETIPAYYAQQLMEKINRTAARMPQVA